MQSGLYTAASGMVTSQHFLDLVTNNLANLNTTGYKKEIPFVRHLETALSKMELKDEFNRARNAAVTIGGGVVDLSPGVLKPTGNPLDLAIAGKGFFAVLTQDGVRYTRAGNFTLSSDNILQTVQGYLPSGDLIREGENLFSVKNPEVEPPEAGDYRIQQGFLETSNVNPIEEMVRLIELTRSAQFYQKMIIATMDTTTQRVINQVGVIR